MKLRLLKYFVAVADEGNITRAAALLHISQPTLSRQLVQLEQDLGVALFDRTGKTMALTAEGVLLRRRADEILELVEKTENELHENDHTVEGIVSIGCGDLASVELLAQFADEFKARHPHVKFDLYCATADLITERMDAGLTDIGLLLEPVDIAKYEYLTTDIADRWIACVNPTDPLAQQASVKASDLIGHPLLLPRRRGARGVIDHWFDDAGVWPEDTSTCNLNCIAATLCKQAGWRAVVIEGSVANWSDAEVVCVPLDPPIESTSVIAWRRDGALGKASRRFIELLRERLGH